MKTVLIIILVIAIFVLLPALVMWLWNLIMPAIFGLNTINYWQALGLMVLIELLFWHRNVSSE